MSEYVTKIIIITIHNNKNKTTITKPASRNIYWYMYIIIIIIIIKITVWSHICVCPGQVTFVGAQVKISRLLITWISNNWPYSGHAPSDCTPTSQKASLLETRWIGCWIWGAKARDKKQVCSLIYTGSLSFLMLWPIWSLAVSAFSIFSLIKYIRLLISLIHRKVKSQPEIMI